MGHKMGHLPHLYLSGNEERCIGERQRENSQNKIAALTTLIIQATRLAVRIRGAWFFL